MPKTSIASNQNKKWTVNNNDDYLANLLELIGGSLFGGNLMDSMRGDIGTSQKLTPHTTRPGIPSITIPQSFVLSNAGMPSTSRQDLYMVDTVRVYGQENYDTSTFGMDTHTGYASVVPQGDINIFGQSAGYDKLLVPTGIDIYMLTGGSSGSWVSWWRNGTYLNQPSLNSNVNHPTAIFQQPFTYLIGDGNLLHTIDQALNVKYARVQLPPYHTIIWIQVSNNTIYLGVQGTANKGQGNGVYTYDIVNEIVQFYQLTALNPTPSCGLIVENNLVVFAEDGRLYQFSGNGFSVYAETPISKKIDSSVYDGNPIYTLIHRNGAQVDKNKMYFLCGGQSYGMPLGIYVFDFADNNFYCAQTFAYGADCYQYLATAVGALYFIPSKAGSSQVQFAGIQPFTDGGTGNNNQGLYSNVNLNAINVPQSFIATFPKTNSPDIQSNWKDVWAKLSLFNSDYLTLKVRSTEWAPSGYLPSSINSTSGGFGSWTSANSFTTTVDLSSINVTLMAGSPPYWTNLEVQIISGTNSGYTGHITNLSYNSGSGLWTVTLDLANGNYFVGANCYFVVTPFQKVATLMAGSAIPQQSNFSGIPTTMSSTEWIQVKAELIGTYSRLKDIIIEVNTKITPR